jgi:hypothetical protein
MDKALCAHRGSHSWAGSCRYSGGFPHRRPVKTSARLIAKNVRRVADARTCFARQPSLAAGPGPMTSGCPAPGNTTHNQAAATAVINPMTRAIPVSLPSLLQLAFIASCPCTARFDSLPPPRSRLSPHSEHLPHAVPSGYTRTLTTVPTAAAGARAPMAAFAPQEKRQARPSQQIAS